MASAHLSDLAELIQTLRESGVVWYEYNGLKMQIAPEAQTPISVRLEGQDRPQEEGDGNKIGYRHPSLRLTSYPESSFDPRTIFKKDE